MEDKIVQIAEPEPMGEVEKPRSPLGGADGVILEEDENLSRSDN